MVTFSDILYFNLLKKAGIVVLALGIIFAIIVIGSYVKFGSGVSDVKQNSFYGCRNDSDCFEWCGECRTMSDGRTCESTGIICKCSSNLCAPA